MDIYVSIFPLKSLYDMNEERFEKDSNKKLLLFIVKWYKDENFFKKNREIFH